MPNPSNIARFSPAPMRDYARDAVQAVEQDRRKGVLAWRIANHLCLQTRAATGRPTAELTQVTPAEREHYLQLAAAVVALTESIDTTAPPTAFEIVRYEQRKALGLARAKGRIEARRLGHEMDVFRPSSDGYELATCRRCGAGVSIHIETAEVSASRQLGLPCEANGR